MLLSNKPLQLTNEVSSASLNSDHSQVNTYSLDAPMAIRLHVRGWTWDYGGHEHEGWLPSGVADPLPTPQARIPVNLDILPQSGGWLLVWELASSVSAR